MSVDIDGVGGSVASSELVLCVCVIFCQGNHVPQMAEHME